MSDLVQTHKELAKAGVGPFYPNRDFMTIHPPTVPRSVFECERHPSCPPELKRQLRAYRRRIDSMPTLRVRTDKIKMPKFALPDQP